MGYGGGERLSSLGTERRSLSRARAAEHIVPHCKKDSKAETKESDGAPLSELIELRNCSSCLFFEKDLYLQMVQCPSGPSVKFLVNAVYTMEELKLTGNHLKGSHPVLTFFLVVSSWLIAFLSLHGVGFIKNDFVANIVLGLLRLIFSIPKDHWKVKPFHDHFFVFPIVDDHIWFRNYQVIYPIHYKDDT
ncbi:ribosome biogenesis protein BRX1 [Musa troglodytarum]|uniref:Ribosome biogenesis protein BRX1 n=1 Tax=Musa troglodytarum TaxID=320322 RepID=A0A9E7JP78_9LILI|nr:ribosome biogenesis protein BRX1 [Musa troglodytarum]